MRGVGLARLFFVESRGNPLPPKGVLALRVPVPKKSPWRAVLLDKIAGGDKLRLDLNIIARICAKRILRFLPASASPKCPHASANPQSGC